MKTQSSRLARSLCFALALGGFAHAGTAADADMERHGGPLPAQELTGRTVYEFLLAEIAGARGQLGVSARLYLDLARATRDPRVARRATEIAMYARNAGMSTEAARLWAELAPQSREAQRVLAGVTGAGISGDEDNLDNVQIQLARVLAQSSDRLPQNLLGINRALLSIPDKQAVQRIVQRITEPYLELPEAHIARAQAAMMAEDPMQALPAVDTALQLRPSWEPAVVLKAQILQQGGAAPEAVRLLESELQARPDNQNLRLTHARALVSAQRFREARTEFERLLEVRPNDAELLYAVALLSEQLGEYQTSEEQFQRALDAGYPQPDIIHLQLGQLAERAGDGVTARRRFGEVRDPANVPEAMIRSAQSLAREGDVDEARALLRAQDDGAGDPAAGHRYLLAESQLLRDAGRSEEALALIEEALAKTPDDTDLMYEAAMLAENLDRLDIMENRLRRIIELAPEHAHAYNALGYSLADRGQRLEEAQDLIEYALELRPNDPFILDSMGWVLFRRGNATEALAHLEKAYGLRQDAEIAAHLGEVLWQLERHDEARRILDEALLAHPDNKVLRKTMQDLFGQ